jgi:hypothetical protein
MDRHPRLRSFFLKVCFRAFTSSLGSRSLGTQGRAQQGPDVLAGSWRGRTFAGVKILRPNQIVGFGIRVLQTLTHRNEKDTRPCPTGQHRHSLQVQRASLPFVAAVASRTKSQRQDSEFTQVSKRLHRNPLFFPLHLHGLFAANAGLTRRQRQQRKAWTRARERRRLSLLP